jgi:hypothetical protein
MSRGTSSGGGRREQLARVAAWDFSTLRLTPFQGNWEARQNSEKRLSRVADTIINGMKPQTIGRALGIGLRIGGRIVGQQIAGTAQARTAAPATAGTGKTNRDAARKAGQASRGVARGVGGFLRPFRRVGGILWLEVTGVFFFLPVVVFAPILWRSRASYVHGPDHSTFLLTGGVMLVFFYLSVSSFWRARKR